MAGAKRLRFHWSLSAVGDPLRRAASMGAMTGVPDFQAHLDFCRQAEACGIESLLMAFGFTRPDPIAWSAALGAGTSTIKFLVAVRSGISSPVYFVEQVGTLAAVTGGRVCVNVVAGRTPQEQAYYGDFLDHDARYDRTDEFWAICHALWRGGEVDFEGRHYRIAGASIGGGLAAGQARPEVYVGGGSERAVALAARHGDCLLTLPDAPSRLQERVRPALEAGIDVGLLVSVICGPTREAAVATAAELVEAAGAGAREVHLGVRGRSDSVGFGSAYELAERESSWLTRTLWTGAVPYLGAPSIALVGSADEIADALFAYREIGVTQFLFTGYPDDADQLARFGAEILPLVRDRERAGRSGALA